MSNARVDLFLKQRAVNITVPGNYTLPKWYDAEGKLRTFACRTSRVSPFRMIVDVPVVGRLGDRLTSYFKDFGKFDGYISDTIKGGFLFELEISSSMRENLARKLTWLEKRQKEPATRDLRIDARFIPENAHSTITFADRSTHDCFVIDTSVSGVAVSAAIQPEIGTPLAVGACVGRVVRLLPNGFAVQFIEQQDRAHVARLIALPITTNARRTSSLLGATSSSEPDKDETQAQSNRYIAIE